MEHIINKLVVVMLNITLWQGRKKLRTEDLEEKGINTASLPPEKLASLGSKRIVSTDAVSDFMRLKRQAERACIAVGTRCLGGYAIPEDKLAGLLAELDAVKAEFVVAKRHFLQEYETNVDVWAEENPEWEDAIRRAVDPKQVVDGQLQFGFTPFRLGFAVGAETHLEEEVQGLRGQLSREIAQAAKTVWEESFHGKLSVTQKAVNRLKGIQDKLDGLSFLDGSIGTLSAGITAAVEQCKGKTPVEGADLMAINGALAMLLNLDRTRFSREADQAEVRAKPVEQEQPAIVQVIQPDLLSVVHVVEPPAAIIRQEQPVFDYKPPVQQETVSTAGWF